MSDYVILYGAAVLSLLVSVSKDKMKTGMALKKAWQALDNILPQFLAVITLVGIMLALLNQEIILKLIGSTSGWPGVLLASIVGAVTLIPGFIAFPTAAMLLQGGAGYMQIGAFISSLMMVGVVTFPVEAKYFGKKVSLVRNLLAYVFSFLVAFIIGKVVGGL